MIQESSRPAFSTRFFVAVVPALNFPAVQSEALACFLYYPEGAI